MRRFALGAVMVSVVIACGGDSPSTPSPPAAALVTQGRLSVSGCSRSGSGWYCYYQGEAVNNGAGCAIRVRGTTRSFAAGQQLSVTEWSLDVRRMIRPNETFLYSGSNLIAPLEGDWTYRTEMSWDNVRCS